MNSKFIAKVVGVAMVLSVVFAGAGSAGAVTVQELQAQIDALLAQLAALSGGSTTSTGSGAACYAFTRNLTLGATGADVVQLQTFLEEMNFLTIPTGVSKGYFGPLTQSALASYQSANGISPAVGYFGPITMGSVKAKCSTTGTGSTGTGSTGSTTLQGGAGSISSADYVSGLNNEEVGEDADDVEVAGLDIEADDNSDIEIVAVNLNFSKGSGATEDFDEYASEVSIYLDGKKLAEVDADEFEDDDNYDKTVSLSAGGIIKAGDEGRLVVKVSGVANLDSTEVGDAWTVEFESVRFRDAQNAVITDTTTGDINDGSGRTFTFESFATASDASLKAKLSSDNIESTVVNVDDTSDTDGVELLRFTLEAEGDSDLRLRDLPITFTVTGATDIDAVAHTAYVTIDGEEFSETLSTSSAAASTTFEDFDYTIEAGDTVEVVVEVDLNDLGSGFDEGDTIKAEFTADNREVLDVDDESGETLASGDRTGTALGEVMGLYDVAPMVELVSISESSTVDDGDDDDSATFIIKYKVTAIDGDIYVSDTATATTATSITAATVASNQVLYLVDQSGTATTADLTGSVVSFKSNGNSVTDSGVTNGVKVTEGSTGEFTLTVVRQNSGDANDNGSFRAALKGISWATTDTATQNVYDFNLEDFESDYVTIN